MEVWIGMVEVRPLPGNTILGDGKGAFVNAFAFVSNTQEYKEAVKAALEEALLLAIDFQDIEPFSERTARQDLSEQFQELAGWTKLTGEVALDDFHVYKNFDG